MNIRKIKDYLCDEKNEGVFSNTNYQITGANFLGPVIAKRYGQDMLILTIGLIQPSKLYFLLPAYSYLFAMNGHNTRSKESARFGCSKPVGQRGSGVSRHTVFNGRENYQLNPTKINYEN